MQTYACIHSHKQLSRPTTCPHKETMCVSVCVGTKADGAVNTLWHLSIQQHAHTHKHVHMLK